MRKERGRGEREGEGQGAWGGATIRQIILSFPVSLEATQAPYTKLCKLYPRFPKILPPTDF